MSVKQTIRKNIVTGEWEHYVDVPLFENNHWVPGIFNYYGEFPISETTHSLMRNGEEYLLSYEDIKYEEYDVTAYRMLPTYSSVKNIYDIQFTEFYTPPTPLTIEFFKRNPEYEFLDIEAKLSGGYPYRNPDIHYEFKWRVLEYDGRYLNSFISQLDNLSMQKIGIGKYELTVIDSNKISHSQVLEVTQDDLLNAIPVSHFLVNLWFFADDGITNKGYLKATVNPADSEGPYTVEWKGKTGNIMKSEIVDSFAEEKTITLSHYLGVGEYSIVIRDSFGNIATDIEKVTAASFPAGYLDKDDPDGTGVSDEQAPDPDDEGGKPKDDER